MEFTLVSATEDDRPVLRRLMELYRYDFSEFDRADVDVNGEYGYRYLDHYWTEPHRRAFLFQVDGRWAGFGLVRADEPFDMSEFFVLRKYRRQGIGRTAAAQLFERFPGPWKVRQQKTNPAATDFWRQTIPSLCRVLHRRGDRPALRLVVPARVRRRTGRRGGTHYPPGH